MAGGFAGHKAVLRYESTWADGADVPGVPAWVEIKQAKDITLAGTQSDGEVADRRVNQVMDAGGLDDWSISFGYTWSPVADTVYTKLLASKENGTPILVQFLTGTASGSVGIQLPMIVKSLGASTPLQGSGVLSVELKQFPATDASGDIIPKSAVLVA